MSFAEMMPVDTVWERPNGQRPDPISDSISCEAPSGIASGCILKGLNQRHIVFRTTPRIFASSSSSEPSTRVMVALMTSAFSTTWKLVKMTVVLDQKPVPIPCPRGMGSGVEEPVAIAQKGKKILQARHSSAS